MALITALLVVSLASLAAVSMANRQTYDVRRTSNLINADQAWLYAWGAEGWATAILARDLKDNKFDSLSEPWAGALPPIELPGGFITGNIIDLQGRFNINNLIEGDKVNTASFNQFQRLLESLELDKDLAQAVVDWLDKNIDATASAGAEDDYYMGLEVPYRAGNRIMVSVSELRLVRGFDQATYEKIAPFVTALPVRTTINVNTAPPEVLASISDVIKKQTAADLVEERKEQPFERKDDFTGSDALKQFKLRSDEISNLNVSSQYFLLNSDARIGHSRARVQSLIVRDNRGQIRVLQRSQASL